jgi:predicted phosphodiesterase
MRLALFGDIHGNLIALEAFQARLRELGVTSAVCLGDVSMAGPQPRECIQRLAEWGAPCALGNTDEWCLEPEPQDFQDPNSQKFMDLKLWGVAQLGADERAAVAGYQARVELDLPGGARLAAFHGAPGSNTTLVTYRVTQEEMFHLYAGVDAAVAVCGHSHEQMLRPLGEIVVVNPGSLGRPIEFNSGGGMCWRTWAEFAILDYEPGRMTLHFERMNYNVEAFFESVRRSGMPHADWFLGKFAP